MKKYFQQKKQELNLIYVLTLLLGTLLPVFSFGIFAPTEIFFANREEFGVVFGEFGWKFLGWGLGLTAIVAFVLFWLPKAVSKIILCALWIFSICGYVQTMFLNRNMDLIGATTFGYEPTTAVAVKDLIIWAVVAVAAIILIVVSKKNWIKLILVTSFILIATQTVAYVSLFIGADEQTFAYEAGELTLDGTERFTVSSEGNIIVFILDTCSNVAYDEWLLPDYPEAADILKDFTYYNNADSCDFGTFPTVCHLLTGNAFDPTQGVLDYFEESWTNDRTVQYYSELHEQGYQVKVYMQEPWLFAGDMSLELVQGEVDNLIEDNFGREIDYPLLYQTLLTMSCYRFMPDYFKPYFDVPNNQYIGLVTYPDNFIDWDNPDFYEHLQENGLTATDESKYVIYYHLNGIHELVNDENCERIDGYGDSISDSMMGIWKMLDTYMDDLKTVDAYDNSTIIICADHGSEYNCQPMFFIKEAGVTRDATVTTTAPITWNEILPTMAQAAGLDPEDYGETIYDYEDGEWRTRSTCVRAEDYDYPAVDCYNGTKDISHLVYHIYTYTGNREEYQSKYMLEEYETVPGVDAYYH